MKHCIWKYPLELEGEQSITIPRNSKILSVQTQNDKICMWIECPTISIKNNLNNNKIIYIVGTGTLFNIKENVHYVSSVQMKGYVWHIYEKR